MVPTEMVGRDKARPVPPQPALTRGAVVNIPWPSEAVAREYAHWLNLTVGEKWTTWEWRYLGRSQGCIWFSDPAMASWFILRWGLDNVAVCLL